MVQSWVHGCVSLFLVAAFFVTLLVAIVVTTVFVTAVFARIRNVIVAASYFLQSLHKSFRGYWYW